jgi:hypothetical protein
VKTGDAKLWVYCCEISYDRQAAESHNIDCAIRPGFDKSGFFYRMATFHHATPVGSRIAQRRKAMFRNFKVLLLALVVIVIAGSAYAFAAANTIPANNVGSGASTVSGYVISNIEYNFAAGDPTQIATIEFDLDKPAGTVKIQLDATAVSGDTDWDWTTCAISTLHVTCTPGSTLLTADIKDLNIAASTN